MRYSGNEIAIVGIDLNLPGSNSIDEFWSNLINSKESICNISEKDIESNHELYKKKNYVNRISVCEDYDKFDAHFFGYSKHEAKTMDPQHRLFLQSCWKALENSGYAPSKIAGNVGVFGSAGYYTYLIEALKRSSDYIEEQGFYDVLVGNDKDYLATRVSYKLGLKGPSVSVQTACSSSLVAVHLASQSLLLGEADMCLAGGACVRVPCDKGYLYESGFILSEDGHCRAFDKNSSGTVFGSGVGVVVLKRLEDAMEDGDTIYSIIKASAINNDGSRKIGYTAPSQEGQEEVLDRVISLEEIEPQSIAFVEAHGTGTILGDPIELKGLINSIGLENDYENAKYPCAISTVKSNIGHMDAASGVAGLIKASLCIYHKTIVPTVHFKELNKNVSFDKTRFYISDKVEKLTRNEYPIRAVVSAFGVGGTNANVILEEPPIQAQYMETENRTYIVKASAKTEEALVRMSKNIDEVLSADSIGAIAYTLNTGREDFEYRKYSIVRKNKACNNIVKTSDSFKVEYIKNGICFLRSDIDNIQEWIEIYESIEAFKTYINQWLNVASNPFEGTEFSDLIKISKKEKSYHLLSFIIQMAYLSTIKEIANLSEIRENGSNKFGEAYLNGIISKEEAIRKLNNEAVSYSLDEMVRNEKELSCKNFSIEEFYDTIGKLWQNGTDIQWEKLFAKEEKKKVAAPTYSFEKNRFWFEEQKLTQSFVWIEEEEINENSYEAYCENCLILATDEAEAYKLKQHLHEIGTKIIEVDTSLYHVKMQDIDKSLKQIIEKAKLDHVSNIKIIICTWGSSKDKIGYEEFYKIIYLSRYFNEHLDRCKNISVVMLLACDFVYENAQASLMMTGIMTTLPKEITHIKVKQIEIYDGIDSIYSTHVLSEIIAKDNISRVIFKDQKRRVIKYKNKPIVDIKEILKENATYLITGGTGNVGLLLAKEISKRVNANLILFSKNHTKETLKNDHSLKGESINRLLNQIIQNGSRIEIHNCDVCDSQKLKRKKEEITSRYGKVDGVIHAAGKVGKAKDYIEHITLKDVYDYTDAKVEGANNLKKVFEDAPLDFFLLTSSTVSVLGGLGDCVYSGANAMLNYMSKLNANEKIPCLSVCFDYLPRAFVDEYVGIKDEKLKNLLADQLKEEEFSQAFDQILSNINERMLIISKTNFDERYRKTMEILNIQEGVNQAQEKKEVLSQLEIKSQVSDVWKHILGDECDENKNFFDAGGDSFLAIKLISLLNHTFDMKFSVKYIYEFPTIRLITENIFEHMNSTYDIEQKDNVQDMETSEDKISVIGMSGKFPGADSIDDLWNNLLNRRCDISYFKKDEAENILNAEPDGIVNKYVGARGILNHIDKFDYNFFGISKMEAELIDPQQRLFLECAWTALEDAGCINFIDKTRVGVFASQGISSYLINYLLKNDEIKKDYNNIAVINNSPDALATRVSYILNLIGISKTVQTFCSSSLVALEEGVASIESGKCDMAIVGGVNIVVPQQSGYIYNEGSIYSEDGIVRPFDNEANGTVFSNGVGVVVIAKKSWVEKNGLHIYSDILGVGVNNDGNQKASYLSPSVKGQAECIAKAYEKAKINPNLLTYMEAHGTATNVGDPIEVYAMAKAIEKFTSHKEFCALGSIKGNVGHLDRAAGITSFIKGCLVASKRCIPPTVNFETPNRNIHFKETAFFVNQEVIEYDKNKDMYVGVSSLGVGGTNVHVVLHSANQEIEIVTPSKRKTHILTLSATQKESFDHYAMKLSNYLSENELDMEKVETTMQIYRKHFPYRKAFVVNSMDAFLDKLSKLDSNHKETMKKVNTIYFVFDTSYNNICKIVSKMNQETLVKSIAEELSFTSNQNYVSDNEVEGILLKLGAEGLEIVKRGIRKYISELVDEKVIIIFGDKESVKKYHSDDRSIIVTFADDKVLSSNNLYVTKDDITDFYSIIAKLWSSGIDIDWNKYNEEINIQNIHLPGYSFKKTSCWIKCK